MAESTEKKLKVKQYGFYANLKGLEKNLGIIVLEVTDTHVNGLKLGVGKTEKCSFTKETFEKLIIYDYIEFVELLPKKVWREFKKIYEK